MIRCKEDIPCKKCWKDAKRSYYKAILDADMELLEPLKQEQRVLFEEARRFFEQNPQSHLTTGVSKEQYLTKSIEMFAHKKAQEYLHKCPNTPYEPIY